MARSVPCLRDRGEGFDPTQLPDPLDPENRRISILVLNKKSEDAMMHDDSTTTTLSDDAAGSGQAPLLQQIAQPPTCAPKAPTVAPH